MGLSTLSKVREIKCYYYLFSFLFMYTNVCLCVYMYTRCPFRRWHWIPWNWHYRCLQATIQMLKTKPRSSGPLQEQPVPLTIETSLPPRLLFCCCFRILFPFWTMVITLSFLQLWKSEGCFPTSPPTSFIYWQGVRALVCTRPGVWEELARDQVGLGNQTLVRLAASASNHWTISRVCLFHGCLLLVWGVFWCVWWGQRWLDFWIPASHLPRAGHTLLYH